MGKETAVAVLMGGICAERDVSLKTGECVAAHLATSFRVKPVELRADGTWEVAAGFLGEGLTDQASAWFGRASRPVLEALATLLDAGIDVVFNALHGPGGEDGSIQGLLRHVGLPFTGPDVTAAAVTMDKRLAKDVLAARGLRTPRSIDLDLAKLANAREWRGEVDRCLAASPLPWVVKPNLLGSSVGVEILADAAALDSFRERVTARGVECLDGTFVPAPGLLVEECVSGRELTCGVLETDSRGARALPPIEIRPRDSVFFDYNAKYTPGASEEICPAPLSRDETASVEKLAVRAHEVFDCAPLSRTDMILGEDGRLTVIEVNTLPGMTETSLIPLAAKEAGLRLEAIFEGLIQHALDRDVEFSRFPGRVSHTL